MSKRDMNKENNNEEREYKNKKWQHIKFLILTAITMLSMTLYIVWRAVFTIPGYKEYGWIPFLLGLALLIAEAASAIEAFAHCVDLTTKNEPDMPDVPPELFPHVDILIATHNEDDDILFKTANACKYIDYPDKSKVHIYLCDDGNRESVRKLAKVIGVGYFGMEKNDLAKAGNLNNAIAQTNSPLIVTFDADMIPNSNFLYETVPYFFLPKMKKEDGKWVMKEKDEIDEDDKIGFIQTPQSFYNPDLFQYNLYSEGRIPNEQDYFFRQVNVARNSSNAPIYAGSNTVISREALEEVGGICTGTITEDFETGLLIEAKGYKCYAINKLLAKGLSPTTVTSLIKQRERWARGCIHSLRRHHIILNPKFPLKLKIAYMTCRSYWDSFVRRFVYIMCPIVFILLGIPSVICGLKELILIWLPNYILYAITLRAVSGNIRNARISNNIDTILFPYLMVPILAEVLHIHKQEFVVTDKSKNQNNNAEKFLALPHIILLVLSVISLIIALRALIIGQSYGTIVIIYWLLVNSASLLMAVFFMFGRKNYRATERFTIKVPIYIMVGNETIESETLDVSEGGMSTLVAKAIYFDDDDIFDVRLTDRDYEATMKVKIASVIEISGKGFKYCFQIVDIDEDNKKEFMQIVFDREHSLPQNISTTYSVYGDIASNVAGRVTKNSRSARKFARLEINREYPLVNRGSVNVKNFNFEYILLEDRVSNPNSCKIELGENVILECHKEKEGLYMVDNIDDLMENPEFRKILSLWDKYD